MRFFVAFIISLLIYALLVWLFIAKFSNIEVTPHKKNDHIVKIDIHNIPIPKKLTLAIPKVQQTKIEKKPIVVTPKPKVVPKKKHIKKKSIKKPIHKKKIIKKRPIHKKVHKKKIIKKKPKIIKKKKPSKKHIPKDESTEGILYIPEPFIQQPKVVKESSDLGSFLSTPSRPKRSSAYYPNRKIKKLYGSSFHNMTPTQKRFIEDNLDTIQEITQRTLTRRGYPELAGKTGQEGTNVVSFYLHPNGDISNLHLKTHIGYRALDENTLTLIRVAYKDYPYPKTTTKIVFYVTYSIYGY